MGEEKQSESVENVWVGTLTSTCCGCYCCCCRLRLGTGCEFPPESSHSSVTSPFLSSSCSPRLAPQRPSPFPFMLFVFFSRLILAFNLPLVSSLFLFFFFLSLSLSFSLFLRHLSSVVCGYFSLPFADWRHERRALGFCRVGWGSRLTDSNCIATEWGRDNDTSDARCWRASGPLQNRTTPHRCVYIQTRIRTCVCMCVYMRKRSQEHVWVCVCICAKFHEEGCCAYTPQRIEVPSKSLASRPFVEVRVEAKHLSTYLLGTFIHIY